MAAASDISPSRPPTASKAAPSARASSSATVTASTGSPAVNSFRAALNTC